MGHRHSRHSVQRREWRAVFVLYLSFCSLFLLYYEYSYSLLLCTDSLTVSQISSMLVAVSQNKTFQWFCIILHEDKKSNEKNTVYTMIQYLYAELYIGRCKCTYYPSRRNSSEYIFCPAAGNRQTTFVSFFSLFVFLHVVCSMHVADVLDPIHCIPTGQTYKCRPHTKRCTL